MALECPKVAQVLKKRCTPRSLPGREHPGLSLPDLLQKGLDDLCPIKCRFKARRGLKALLCPGLPCRVTLHSHAPWEEPFGFLATLACHKASICATNCSDGGIHRAYLRTCSDAMHGAQACTRGAADGQPIPLWHHPCRVAYACKRTFGWTRNLSASVGGTVVAAAAAPAAGAAGRLALPPFPVLGRFAGRCAILP